MSMINSRAMLIGAVSGLFALLAQGVAAAAPADIPSEVVLSAVSTSVFPSDEALSDPQAGEGVETTPDGAPLPPEDADTAARDGERTEKAAVVPGEKIVPHEYQVQQTPYWCSAAAARIALTARGKTVSQAELARYMHVGHAGLLDITNLKNALNHYTGTNHYQVKKWSISVLRSKLTEDVQNDVNQGYAVVIDVTRIGTAYFGGGHYATIVGYRHGGAEFAIADPSKAKRHLIWLSAEDVARGIKLQRYVA